jgi:hypothetical protein
MYLNLNDWGCRDQLVGMILKSPSIMTRSTWYRASKLSTCEINARTKSVSTVWSRFDLLTLMYTRINECIFIISRVYESIQTRCETWYLLYNCSNKWKCGENGDTIQLLCTAIYDEIFQAKNTFSSQYLPIRFLWTISIARKLTTSL